MRILTCLWRSYYGDPVAVNPNYVYFVDLLRNLGHDVCFFDHVAQARLSKEAMNDSFLALVRGGRFDVVFVEMLKDEFYPEVLDEASEACATVAFNSDDDFRWMEYSAKWYPHFRYSVTTYRHIYEHFRSTHPNLVLSPWACGFQYNGLDVAKDIPVSFVGGVHAERGVAVSRLRLRLPIEVYGHGTGRAAATPWALARIAGHKLRGGHGTRDAFKRWASGRLGIAADGLDFESVNALWNRSKISWTPLELGESQYESKLRMSRELGVACENSQSAWATRYQVKGRIFEMGSSGTVMLCNRNQMLDEYYTRGVEYDDFESEDEFVEKASFYLANDETRKRMARAYFDRTIAEHTWERRHAHILRAIGARK